MSGYARPLTPAEIASVEDAQIDFDDIPELDADFWSEAGGCLPSDGIGAQEMVV